MFDNNFDQLYINLIINWYNEATNICKSTTNTNNAIQQWGIFTLSDYQFTAILKHGICNSS